MSDLTATNCGCSTNNTNNGCGSVFGGNNSCLWIILLLLFCNGGNNGCGSSSTFPLFNNGCDNDCSCLWIIILLLFFCNGGNNGCC